MPPGGNRKAPVDVLAGRGFSAVRRFVDRIEAQRAPVALRQRWSAPVVTGTDAASPSFEGRLRRDRTSIIPWLHRTRSLAGQRILEVGCGEGASTISLTEQGAKVVALDVSSTALASARARLRDHQLEASFVEANAAEISDCLAGDEFDWVIFWATLEHMTVDERLAALRGAWDVLEPGGLLTVIETPNRLWYHDSHTSQLPFFMWLPDELAYLVSGQSPRATFGDRYTDPQLAHMEDFRRRGRGVSYHEFDAALGPEARNRVVSCYQLDRRSRQLLRRVGWRLAAAGRYERFLQRVGSGVPTAFCQPYLYLTIEKEALPG